MRLVIIRGGDQATVFPVRLPSGARYWTLLDHELRLVVDEFLRHVRFARDAAESTTYTYAGGLALFLRWCSSSGREWQAAPGHLGMFILWLRHAGPADGPVPLPGAEPVRGARRINTVLAAVREFLKQTARRSAPVRPALTRRRAGARPSRVSNCPERIYQAR